MENTINTFFMLQEESEGYSTIRVPLFQYIRNQLDHKLRIDLISWYMIKEKRKEGKQNERLNQRYHPYNGSTPKN